jgi:microcystin-dependent protein
MVPFGGSTAPAGYLLCAGQNVSRSTYAALFAAIGTTHGNGDGSTTFGLPDMRGRTVVGKDDMGGSAANRVTAGATPGINGATLGASGGAQEILLTQHNVPNNATNLWGGSVEGAADTAATAHTGSAASPHSNMQPSMIWNFIIKT